jgi:hypothetical protein
MLLLERNILLPHGIGRVRKKKKIQKRYLLPSSLLLEYRYSASFLSRKYQGASTAGGCLKTASGNSDPESCFYAVIKNKNYFR